MSSKLVISFTLLTVLWIGSKILFKHKQIRDWLQRMVSILSAKNERTFLCNFDLQDLGFVCIFFRNVLRALLIIGTMSNGEQNDKYSDLEKDNATCNTTVEDDQKFRKDKAQSNWSKIFRPWKWKRKKKSEKFASTAVTLERKISVRSTRDELVKRGVLPGANGPPPIIEEAAEKSKSVDQMKPARARSSLLRGSKVKSRKSKDGIVFSKADKNETVSKVGDNKKEAILPQFNHQKYPSDDIPKEANVNPRMHQHRLSYQIATASDYTKKADNDNYSVNVGRFQIPGSSGNDLVAVGIIGRDVNRNNVGQTTATVKTVQPPDHNDKPMLRTGYDKQPRENQSNYSKFDPGRAAVPSFYSGPAIPPGLMNRLSQDLSRAFKDNIPNDQDEDSSVNRHFPPEEVGPRNAMPVQRPIPAQRTRKTSVPTSAPTNPVVHKGPPPKPPPKPIKHPTTIPDEQINPSIGSTATSRSFAPSMHTVADSKPGVNSRQSEVLFARSADIIQKTTEMKIPPYLQRKYSEPEERPCEPEQNDYDSDSSSSIKYRSDDEEEEEKEDVGGLAAKVMRKDTLALRLAAGRADRDEEIEQNPSSNSQSNDEERSNVKRNLTRRLSQRPTKSELQERNILPNDTAEQRHRERENVKRQLSRKLSMRPTVKELIEKKVLINWHEYVEVYEVQNYDRRGDKPWTRLTPQDKASIRKELNEFKATEMAVHEQSKQYTRFHKP